MPLTQHPRVAPTHLNASGKATIRAHGATLKAERAGWRRQAEFAALMRAARNVQAQALERGAA